MKKIYFILTVLFMASAHFGVAQSWTTYNADVEPGDFDPAFSESNGAGTNDYGTIVDPDDASNNLLEIKTDVDPSSNIQLRQYTDEDAVTVVLKARTVDEAEGLLFDIDFRSTSSARFAIKVLNDGTYDIDKGGDGIVEDKGDWGFTSTEWNIFRITKAGADVNIYLNEDPTPIFTLAADGTADGNGYWRFGDGWSSQNVDTQYDWVTWDYSGAYSPNEVPLPSELTETRLGDWTTYNADVEPGDFDPAFSESNGAGTNDYGTIVDPVVPGNNLLEIKTDVDPSSNIQLRQYTDEDAVTVVLKARTVDEAEGLLFDIDFRSTSSARFAIKVLNDGTYDIDKGGDGIVEDKGDWGFTSTEWNIFRITKAGADVNIYLNEDPTPIFTLAADGTADGNGYWRFGDGWSSQNVDTQYDWVTWDYSGAYSPEQTRLPVDLLNPPLGDWTTYNADVEPGDFDPAFSESNGAGTNDYGTIVDPDDASNNLLEIKTDVDPSSNIQLRQYTDEDAVTVVLKARTVDEAEGLLFDIDFRSTSSARFAIKVLNDGTYDIDKGGDGIVEDKGDWGFTSTEWNIFRITKAGADVNIYLNEDPTPIFTLAADGTADGNGYWRFGDGWSSQNVDTQYDWVTWDYSGAYSPEQTRLPDELTGEVVEVASMKTLGTPDPLFQDIGFASDYSVESYTVSGSNLTGDITITPPANFEVSINEVDWSTNASPLVLTQASGSVENTTIYVRLNAAVTGDYMGDISHSSEGAEDVLVPVSGSTVDQIPAITLTAELTEFVQNVSSPSASQNYRVSGENLKGAITVTAPTDFEVSTDDATWVTEITLDPAEDRTITNALVYVRLNGAAQGDYSGNITHTTTDATDATLPVSGAVIPDPGINVTSDFTAFSQNLGTPSEGQAYTISGSNLAAGISITLPEGFEVSFGSDLWLTSLTLNPLEGNVEELTLYIRLNASESGSVSGDIVHSSAGLDDVTVSVSGTVDSFVLETKLDEQDISFWPNPSTDQVTFVRRNVAGEGKVSLYTLGGTQIETYLLKPGRESLELNISSLPTGLYLLQYESDGEKLNQKFIKQ